MRVLAQAAKALLWKIQERDADGTPGSPSRACGYERGRGAGLTACRTKVWRLVHDSGGFVAAAAVVPRAACGCCLLHLLRSCEAYCHTGISAVISQVPQQGSKLSQTSSPVPAGPAGSGQWALGMEHRGQCGALWPTKCCDSSWPFGPLGSFWAGVRRPVHLLSFRFQIL
jgi:hypothetical protein